MNWPIAGLRLAFDTLRVELVGKAVTTLVAIKPYPMEEGK